MGICTGLQYSFVCNYCTEMVNRKVIEHNASCKSGLSNTSNTDTQRWELKNRDTVENMEIFTHINAKFKYKLKINFEIPFFLLESQRK